MKAGRKGGGVDVLLERRERGIEIGRGWKWKWGLDDAVHGYSTQDSTLQLAAGRAGVGLE